jgi:iron complex transport system substrate-binding protein
MKPLLVVAAALAAVHASAADIRLTDDRGREIVLERPAARIVTLSPHLAEIAFAAGAGAKVVGVSAYTDFPPAVARLPSSPTTAHNRGGRQACRIWRLWVSGNRAPDFDRLRLAAYGFATEARRPEDIARIRRLVGAPAGTGPVWPTPRHGTRGTLRVCASYRGRPQVRVFYEIWPEPLMTVNGRHRPYSSMCAANAADAPPLTPTISREQVLAADPDAIVVAAPAPRAAERIAVWRSWQRLKRVRADPAAHQSPRTDAAGRADAERRGEMIERLPMEGVAELRWGWNSLASWERQPD